MHDCKWKDNGKLKLLIIVGTRPEIIRLAAVIKKCRTYFDTILAHTGQNYDYNLNAVFFHDLELDDPEVYLNAVGADLLRFCMQSPTLSPLRPPRSPSTARRTSVIYSATLPQERGLPSSRNLSL